jgi:hypothetical protein
MKSSKKKGTVSVCVQKNLSVARVMIAHLRIRSSKCASSIPGVVGRAPLSGWGTRRREAHCRASVACLSRVSAEFDVLSIDFFLVYTTMHVGRCR